jgi:carbon-monoxide dehydrogenase medium subunit
MYPFRYCRPTSLTDAVRMFAASDDAAFLSGGHTLLPTLKARLAAPSDVIDLSALPELRGIEQSESGLLIRDRQVRHRGTIGGSVANNDPAADYPAAVLALNATIITDRRRIAADAYFTGLFETCRAPGEIVIAVEFPVPLSAGYAKFCNLASRYAVAATFVARTKAGARVAVTGAYNRGVTRATHFEQALDAGFAAEALDALDIDPEDMLSDPAATAAYRAHLIKVLARRAVARQGEVLIYK